MLLTIWETNVSKYGWFTGNKIETGVEGMIGLVGTTLGTAGVNIDDMDVGRSSEGVPAVMVIASPTAVPTSVQDHLRAQDGIVSVYAIDLK